MNHSQLKSLRQDLQKFGLNPQDWLFAPVGAPNEWHLTHLQDSCFTLRGRMTFNNNQAQWLELVVLTL